MTQDSTALSMSQADQSALSVLLSAAEAIKEVYTLRAKNDELEYQNLAASELAEKQVAKIEAQAQEIARLTEALAQTKNALAQAEADLTATQAKLAEEQRLAGQHWENLQLTKVKLEKATQAYNQTSTELHDTTAKLSEAEGKLAHFRDVLGIAQPVPVKSIPSVEPAQVPSVVSGESSGQTPQTVEAVDSYIGLDQGGNDVISAATFSDDYRTTDPHIASAIDGWYDGNGNTLR